MSRTDPALYSWNQPICERCWISERGTWKQLGSSVGSRLVNVPMPVMFASAERTIERCSWCGGPTIVGIYVREDPRKVPFPALKEPET